MYKNQGRITRRSNANAFIAEYSKVSRVPISKEKRQMKASIAKNIKLNSGPITEEGQNITTQEVQAALDDLDGSKASGQDYIHPKLLKNLPKLAIKEITEIFNQSLEKTQVPQNWRQGEIIPLLKSNKPPEEISSY
jgi:hypothetical protein